MSWFQKAELEAAPLDIETPIGFELPSKTQWAFTPNLQSRANEGGMSGAILTGTSLGEHVTLHHAGDGQEFSVQRPDDYASGLIFDFTDFEGEFFSLAVELPEDGFKDLGPQDLLRIALQTNAEEPFEAYARLNLCHGPNTEQITRMIRIGDGDTFAEFDIFYTEVEQGRATSVWVDLIINNPKGKKLSLDQIVVLRRARASL